MEKPKGSPACKQRSRRAPSWAESPFESAQGSAFFVFGVDSLTKYIFYIDFNDSNNF